jgi:hypothetical protein
MDEEARAWPCVAKIGMNLRQSRCGNRREIRPSDLGATQFHVAEGLSDMPGSCRGPGIPQYSIERASAQQIVLPI